MIVYLSANYITYYLYYLLSYLQTCGVAKHENGSLREVMPVALKEPADLDDVAD